MKAKLTSIEWKRIVYLRESNKNTCEGPLWRIRTTKSKLFSLLLSCYHYEMAWDKALGSSPKFKGRAAGQAAGKEARRERELRRSVKEKNQEREVLCSRRSGWGGAGYQDSQVCHLEAQARRG